MRTLTLSYPLIYANLASLFHHVQHSLCVPYEIPLDLLLTGVNVILYPSLARNVHPKLNPNLSVLPKSMCLSPPPGFDTLVVLVYVSPSWTGRMTSAVQSDLTLYSLPLKHITPSYSCPKS